jgi:hypothetical protein
MLVVVLSLIRVDRRGWVGWRRCQPSSAQDQEIDLVLGGIIRELIAVPGGNKILRIDVHADGDANAADGMRQVDVGEAGA